MYLCICICIHVNVCHVYILCIYICIHVNICHVFIVCHVYIHTCVYPVRVDLNIILLVVSNGDDSTKGWKSLFGNVVVFEVMNFMNFWLILSTVVEGSLGEKCFCGGAKIVTSNRRELTYTPPGGSLGYVHGLGYPAPLRTDMWHPALTEEDLKGKGVFFSKKNISIDFVEHCDFLINKFLIFHEFTHIVT